MYQNLYALFKLQRTYYIYEHSKSSTMSILITHGYLLTGTGSNLYVNNLVRELVRKGHDVILVCQDFDPMLIDFVNEVFSFDAANTSYCLTGAKESPFKGKCRCFIPNLNGFLPVYVYDHYQGFEVKEFTSCTTEETMRYVDQNLNAMRCIVRDFEVEVVNTNHMVMFPYIATQLKKEYAFKFVITVHGSALNFTVKKDKRFEAYAIESLLAVDEIVVDSLHADEELKEFLHDVKLEHLIQKMEIIPAGVDISSFGIASESREKLISDFKSSIATNVSISEGRDGLTSEKILNANLTENNITPLVDEVRKAYDYRGIDKDAISKMEGLDLKGNNIMFVGKYLWTKGIYLILLAIPKILKENPNTNFIISGFGPFREPAEIIVNCLATGNVDLLLKSVKNNPLFHGDEGKHLPLIIDILEKHGASIQKDVQALNFDIRSKITFTGILNHKQLVNLLPAMDVLIAPSVFPEAFGMVAIEAASCGVYPVLTYQSAFREIGDQIRELVDGRVHIDNVELNVTASDNIANNTNAYLKTRDNMSEAQLIAFKESLRKLVVDNYSWEGIAGKYLKTYLG